MINTKIESLFPVPVQITTCNDLLKQPLIDHCVAQNDATRNANIGNWRSRSSCVLEAPELDELKEFVIQSIEIYKQTILNNTDVDVYITQSWLNFSESGQYHHVHYHPNSIVSGVFYIQTTDEDKITFHSPHEEMYRLRIQPKQFSSLNSPTWWYPATQGSLLLFPSNLRHNVETVTASSTRISLSFNTFVRGAMGSEYDSTQLILK